MSPQEIAELYRIALARTGNKERARCCVEAYLAGQHGFYPITRTRNGISKSKPKDNGEDG